MKRKIQDIKSADENPRVDLSEGRKRPEKKMTKPKKNPVFLKRNNKITPVHDIQSSEKTNFIYLRGKNFAPPKFLGNLLKIGLVGVLILVLINGVSIYFTSKKLKEEVSAEAYEGYHYLIDGGKNASKINFENALSSFENAKAQFSQAQETLWFITTDNSLYSKNATTASAIKTLLDGGENFAVAGKYFLEALEEFNKIPLYFVSKNQHPDQPVPSITDAIKAGLDKTNLAVKEIKSASDKMSKIDVDSLPVEVRARVLMAQQRVGEISTLLNDISTQFPAILKLLGDRHPHRYLILLQNNHEVRPTGGFIGSYAIVDVNDGYIENIAVEDVYDLESNNGKIIEPPDEIKPLTGNWTFRDSNYSYDFPTSAQKARWFLETEGGPTVDTVIAINQGLLKDMLDITGPVQVGGFGKLDSENYNILLSYIIEGKIWGAEDPKHILKIFIPAFKEAILKEEKLGQIGPKIYKAIIQKHIMMYSSDSEVQEFFDAFGLSGRAHESAENEDYLAVINTSVSGTKSDQFIEEKISHETHIAKYGNIVDELKITHTHQWDDAVYLQWEAILKKYGLSLTQVPPHIVDVLGRGRNKVKMRIYVPADTLLLDSSDPSVELMYDKDLKKSYFAATMEVNAGESKELQIKYQLPFTLNFHSFPAAYKIVIEKQPGSKGSILNKSFTTDPEVNVLSRYPENDQELNTNLVYDRYFSLLLED